VFGYNTNVQMGEPVHLFYSTAYMFKNTQKEDPNRFIRIGTEVVKRLHRIQRIALENAALEDEPEDNDTEISGPDFLEGLSRMLSGMCANMSKAVCSSPMAHHIVNNNGSHFEYSHSFTNLLFRQTIIDLEGGEGQFRIRKNYSTIEQKTVLWSGSTLDGYTERDEALENVCMYEFVT